MMQHFREPVSGFTHLGGAVLAFFGLITLIVETFDDPAKMASMIVYGISLILLYSASTALHLTRGTPRTIRWLRSFDHAAIYLLIAGTYTPFCYNVLSGKWRWGMLGVIWALAVIGVIYKLFFIRKDHSHLSTLFYVGMGWLAVFVLPQAVAQLPPGAVILIAGGGLLYTIGAVIFALRKPNFHRHFGFHEVWHLFTLGGSALHFAAIALYIA